MEDLYIRVLRFGKNNEEVKFNDLVNHLAKSDKNITFHHTRLRHIFSSSFETYDRREVDKNSPEICFLKTEALAYLLSYDSFEQAKKDSRKAIKLAIWSILTSALLALTAIVLQVMDFINK